MKRFLAFLFATLLITTAAKAEQRIKIQEVGFGGWTSPRSPTSVRVSLSSDVALHDAQLVVLTTSGNSGEKTTDEFVLPLQLEAQQPKDISVPVSLRGWMNLEFVAELRAANGTVLATDAFANNLNTANQNMTVVVLCQGATCESVQKSILFSGSDGENERKNNQLKVLTTGRPRDNWWEYLPASHVVAAIPVEKLSNEQKSALEGYARAGGRLILLQGEIQDSAWLGPYRAEAQERTGTAIGRGTLRQISDVNSPELGHIFNALVLDGVGLRPQPLSFSSPAARFLDRNSLKFRFPTALWLLVAMGVYILVIGLVNFAILRKIRKLQLGWITVPVMAVAFALFLFLFSSSKRPVRPELDEIAVSWLDSHSETAFVDYRLRVSTPNTADVTVSAPAQALLTSPDWKAFSTIQELAGAFGRHQLVTDGSRIVLGPQIEVPVNLLRWSSRDIGFSGMKDLGGTVELINGKLTNKSSHDFSDAIVCDNLTHRVYMLQKFPSGAEVELSKVKASGMQIVASDMRVRLEQTDPPPPFDVREVVLDSNLEGSVFYGVTDGPTLGAKLSTSDYAHRTAALIVVGLN